jgi:D-alanyl-lipoteichoic acid acyltransferase DltB (MBOAT superfamily)
MSLTTIFYPLAVLLSVIVFAKARSRTVRQSVLLIVSYLVYISWGPWFVIVLLASTVVNYFCGEWLRKERSGLILLLGILFNLLLLASFKYLPEVSPALPFSSLKKFEHVALPLGISFWTFQAMSYLVDIYQGEQIDPTFFEFALYMVFFPVTISGPVCRMPEMLPQFRSENAIRWDDIGHGLARIATGLLMMQMARLLGQGILAGDGINSGFDVATHWTGTDVWCLAIGYGLQLFFDFAGYSHIAIGAAKMLGITLPENFARPFASTSPSMFWTRWHMSLSFWIRDYVFFPLMQMRRETWWRNLALVIAMVLFGLWHKAAVLFIIWGAYHGVLLVLHRQIEGLERRFDWTPPALWRPISWFTTILLVNVGWIFFRANSLLKAKEMLAAVASPASYSSHSLSGSLYGLVLAVAAGYAIVVLASDALKSSASPLSRTLWYWVPPLYALLLLVVLVVTHSQTASAAQFMYRSF